MAIEQNSIIWVGTAFDGLFKFDGKDWIQYNKENSKIPGSAINSITIDSYGNKWICTDQGLAVYREGGVKGITDVKENPDKYYSSTAYTNSFHNSTVIEYDVQETNSVKLSVFDAYGNEVSGFGSKLHTPGEYQYVFDAENVSPGIYFYKLQIGNKIETGKLVMYRWINWDSVVSNGTVS